MPLSSERSSDVMPWVLRRRLRAPVSVTVADLHAGAEGRAALMRTCRGTLAADGFTFQLRRGWRDTVVDEKAAAVAVARAEARADRDDYWWDGTLCWTRPDGSSVVALEQDGAALRLVAWGPGGEAALHALDVPL